MAVYTHGTIWETGNTNAGGESLANKRRYKDALSRNRSIEEIAEEMGLSSGAPRDKGRRKLYKIRNAGQGQVKIRGENQNK